MRLSWLYLRFNADSQLSNCILNLGVGSEYFQNLLHKEVCEGKVSFHCTLLVSFPVEGI